MKRLYERWRLSVRSRNCIRRARISLARMSGTAPNPLRGSKQGTFTRFPICFWCFFCCLHKFLVFSPFRELFIDCILIVLSDNCNCSCWILSEDFWEDKKQQKRFSQILLRPLPDVLLFISGVYCSIFIKFNTHLHKCPVFLYESSKLSALPIGRMLIVVTIGLYVCMWSLLVDLPRGRVTQPSQKFTSMILGHFWTTFIFGHGRETPWLSYSGGGNSTVTKNSPGWFLGHFEKLWLFGHGWVTCPPHKWSTEPKFSIFSKNVFEYIVWNTHASTQANIFVKLHFSTVI